jgi:hypothetical protein
LAQRICIWVLSILLSNLLRFSKFWAVCVGQRGVRLNINWANAEWDSTLTSQRGMNVKILNMLANFKIISTIYKLRALTQSTLRPTPRRLSGLNIKKNWPMRSKTGKLKKISNSFIRRQFSRNITLKHLYGSKISQKTR